MVTRYSVWLNKKGLSELDPSIIVLDIAYGAPKIANTTFARAKAPGMAVVKRHVQGTSVTITFEIHDWNTRRRQMTLQKIQQWAAKGGWLSTNDRPAQRLMVICDSLPTITSALKWTEKIKMTFTAYERPYWEDEYERQASVSGVNGNSSLYVGGVADESPVSANVTNTSGQTVNSLSLSVGDTFFEFENLGLAPGGVLKIGYDDSGILHMRVGDVSKMDKRTGASSDNLMTVCGAHTKCSVIADNAVSVIFKARGLYL